MLIFKYLILGKNISLMLQFKNSSCNTKQQSCNTLTFNNLHNKTHSKRRRNQRKFMAKLKN